MEKKQIEAELEMELAMRKKVWKHVNGAFCNRELQESYDILEYTLTLIQNISPHDYQKLKAKIEGKQIVQGSLL